MLDMAHAGSTNSLLGTVRKDFHESGQNQQKQHWKLFLPLLYRKTKITYLSLDVSVPICETGTCLSVTCFCDWHVSESNPPKCYC